MTATEVGIVVVTAGFPDLLEDNLGGLGRSVSSGRIVVVDNFSGLAQRDATTDLCARMGWTLLAPGLDLGFAAAVNAAVRLLRSRGCTLLLVLDPAVRIDELGVLALAAGCAADPQRILTPRIVGTDGSGWFGGGTVDIRRGRTQTNGDADSSAPAGWLSGACLMIHASLWDWLDGFDETYFRHWEDVDLSWRCVAAGGSLAVRDDVRVVRGAGGSRGGAGSTPLDVYASCRNRLVFAARHLGRWHLLRWLLLSPAYAVEVLRNDGSDPARQAGPLVAAAVRGTGAGATLALRSLAAPRPSGRMRRPAPAEKRTAG